MKLNILLLLIAIQSCQTNVLFRIESVREDMKLRSAYLLATTQLAEQFIWSHLTNKTRVVIGESKQIWVPSDFTNPHYKNYVSRCVFSALTQQEKDKVFVGTLPDFVKEKGSKYTNKLSRSDNIIWEQWMIKTYLPNYLSTNYTHDGKGLTPGQFDLKIILDAYQTGREVGSLESFPTTCPERENKEKAYKDALSSDGLLATSSLNRLYLCDLLDDKFVGSLFNDKEMEVLHKRNHQMAERINELLKRKPYVKFLFAVSFAHIFGNNSIVDILEHKFGEHGYRFERINHSMATTLPEFCADGKIAELTDARNAADPEIMANVIKSSLNTPISVGDALFSILYS